jgi:hypothetical protein
MIPAELAVSRMQRDLALSALVKAALLIAAGLCLFVGPIFNWGAPGTLLLIGLAVVWIVLSHRSARTTRGVMDAPSLIAAGHFEQAELQLDHALRAFTEFRTVKLLSVHHLAMLRHAQRRWQESATLCQALQRQKLGGLHGLLRPSRLILADSLLQLGDLNNTYRCISEMYGQRLSLAEAIKLLVLQLDYESRVGAWQNMTVNLPSKIQLTELMNTRESAQSQALLALAARKTNQVEWSTWLWRRATLLVDANELVQQRPVLSEMTSTN